MIRSLRIISMATCLAFLTSTIPAFADDNMFEDTFKSAFYGGAVGALVGAALMAFTKKPADHLENILYGGAAGVLVGAAYGVTRSARSLAEVNDGKVKIGLPTIVPDLVPARSNGQMTVAWKADLLRGTFH